MSGGALFGRPTVELVVLLFAAVVSLTLLVLGVGLLVVILTVPEYPTTNAAQALAGAFTSVLAALLGLLGGRGLARMEQERP